MTRIELQTLDLVRERITVAGFAPSVREIASETGHGVQTVHNALSRLEKSGHLIRLRNRARGLRLPDVADMRNVPTDTMLAELARRGATLEALDYRPRDQFRRGATCAADSCQAPVRVGMLFCRRHWFGLPHSLQRDIKSAFADKDEALFEQYVTEARDRIDRGARSADPRRPS